jgi:large subunit ribosomal protein L13
VKTFSAKPGDINKEWHIIDATNLVVGRVASEIAKLLRGKHKPTFTPHMDCGDNIVVINAAKISLTGNKMARKDGKIYYRHTGYIGGIKETTAGKIIEGKHPERVLQLAVKRMLSRGKLGSKQFSNLYVYPGDEHPHVGQKPKQYDFASKNIKNKK